MGGEISQLRSFFNAISTPLGSGAALGPAQQGLANRVGNTITKLLGTQTSAALSELKQKWQALSDASNQGGYTTADLQKMVQEVRQLIDRLTNEATTKSLVVKDTTNWSDPAIQSLLDRVTTPEHDAFEQRFPNLVRYGKELVTSILDEDLGPDVKKALLESGDAVATQETFSMLLLWDLARRNIPFSEIPGNKIGQMQSYVDEGHFGTPVHGRPVSEFLEILKKEMESCQKRLSNLSPGDVIDIITDTTGEKVFPNDPALRELASELFPERRDYNTLREVVSKSFYPSQDVVPHALFYAYYAKSPEHVVKTLSAESKRQDPSEICLKLLQYLNDKDANAIRDIINFKVSDPDATISAVKTLAYTAGVHRDISIFTFIDSLPDVVDIDSLPDVVDDASGLIYPKPDAYHAFFSGLAHAPPPVDDMGFDDTMLRDALSKVPQSLHDMCLTSFIIGIMKNDPETAIKLVREVEYQQINLYEKVLHDHAKVDPEGAFSLIERYVPKEAQTSFYFKLLKDVTQQGKIHTALKLFKTGREVYGAEGCKYIAQRSLENKMPKEALEAVAEEVENIGKGELGRDLGRILSDAITYMCQRYGLDKTMDYIRSMKTSDKMRDYMFFCLVDGHREQLAPDKLWECVDNIRDKNILRSVLSRVTETLARELTMNRDVDAIAYLRSDLVPERLRDEWYRLLIFNMISKDTKKAHELVRKLQDEKGQRTDYGNEVHSEILEYFMQNDTDLAVEVLEIFVANGLSSEEILRFFKRANERTPEKVLEIFFKSKEVEGLQDVLSKLRTALLKRRAPSVAPSVDDEKVSGKKKRPL